MKRRMIALLLCVVLSSALAVGCGSSKKETKASAEETEEPEEESREEPEEIQEAEEPEEKSDAGEEDAPMYEEGRWDGTVYTNEALGITMTVPDSFLVMTGEELREVMGAAQDEVLGDTALGEVADTSEVVYDFMAMSSDMLGNVMLSVEKNKMHMSAEQYGNALKIAMKVYGAECEMLEDPAVRNIGDTDFYELKMQLDYSEMTGIDGYVARQSYLIHADDNYLYYFTVTFNPDNVQEIEDVMNTLQPL